MGGPVRIAIVNDYQMVVAGLSAMLEPYADRIEVVELDVDETPDSQVDLALYDTFAQQQGGAVDCQAIAEDSSARWLVVYSWSTSPHAPAQALAKGARGYVCKSVPAGELVDALERVAAGETVVLAPLGAEPDPESDVSHASGQRSWPGGREGLSEREAEVVALIAQGLSNDQIAVRAGLSINTVKSYIRSGYRKIGAGSRTQAVLWALEHGLGPDRDG